MLEQALKKLETERGSANGLSRTAQVMSGPVADKLIMFCHQDEEFAQAVVQGGSFRDCMNTVAKNCGSSISDLEAYRRAVQFFFPGAEVRMTLTIDLCGDVGQAEHASSSGIVLNLTDFL